MPYAIVRIFTATDERTARWTLVWAGLIGNIFYIALIIIGSAAAFFIAQYHPIAQQLKGQVVEFKGVSKPFEEWPPLVQSIIVLSTLAKTYNVPGTNIADYSTLAVAEAVGNSVVLGLLTAGALAIAMPTIASWAVLMSTIVARDWPRHVFKTQLPPEREILYARIAATIIIAASALIALSPPALILDMSGAAFVVLVSTLGPPLLLGIWWRRPGKNALLAHVIIMFPLTAFSWLYAKYAHGTPHAFFLDPKYATPHQAYWVLLSFLIFALLAYVFPPPKRETVEKYVDALHA
jgi:SSS family solute:Na+ symporter